MLGRRLLAAAALVSAGFIAGSASAQRVAPLPDQQNLGRYGVTRSWHVQVPLLGREKVVNLLVHEGTVLVDQEGEMNQVLADVKAGKRRDLNAPREFKRQREAMLFVATDHGQLHCLDADTGLIKWSQKIALEGDVTYRPAVTDKYVYAVSGTKLLRIDKRSGRTLIERELPDIANASPAATDYHVFVPAGNSIWCYEVPDPKLEGKAGPGAGLQGERFIPDPVNGGKMFNVHVPPGQTRRFEKLPSPWHYSLNVPFNSAPILFKNAVIAVASDGTMTSFKQEFGERNWIHHNGHNVIAPLGVMDHFVYLASSDFAVYCIDIRFGKERWRFPSGFPVYQQPVPFSTEVLVFTEGGGLTCLDNKHGEPLWTNDAIRRLVGVSKDHVFAADRHNVVQVLSRKTGGVLGSLPLSDYTVTPVNQFNDRLYMASQDGQVLCLHELASPAPYLHPQTSGIEDETVMQRDLAKKIGGEEKSPDKKPKPKVVKKKTDDDSGDDAPEEKKPATKPAPKPKAKKDSEKGGEKGKGKKKNDGF
jgi:outer membrane protein assembly factor BamB